MLRNRDGDYLRAAPNQDMVVPEGIHQPSFEPLYPIPEVDVSDEFGDAVNLDDFEVPRPNTASASENNFGVRIKKIQDTRWIHLSAPTAQVWPHVQSFLNEGDIRVVFSDAKAGVIETDWYQFKDAKDSMLRFRISIEKGFVTENTEVHVVVFEQPLDGDPMAPAVWPEQSQNKEREEWMVRTLAKYLVESVSTASASLLGQNVGGEAKAQFSMHDSEPALRLNVNKIRAWATLTHSARQGGFVTWDHSEAKGLIFLGYNKDQRKPRSFWSKVWSFGRSGKLPEKVDRSLDDVLSRLNGTADVRNVFGQFEGVAYQSSKKTKPSGYLVLMRFDADGAYVVIRDDRGARLPVSKAKALVRELRENLI